MTDKNLHNENEDLKNEAPFLFSLKKEEPYEAPVGYFEKFQSELSDKIHAPKRTWWEVILKPVIWAPAMVLLLAGGIFLFKGDSAHTTSTATGLPEEEIQLQDLSFETLDTYVNENLLAQANTDEIMDMVGEHNLPSLGIHPESSTVPSEEIPAIQHVDEQEMEEYIMDNLDEMEVY